MSTTQARQTKMQAMVKATRRFIENFHRPGFDRGMVMSFGNSCRVDCDFTGNPSQLHAAIQSLTHMNGNERTRYYDSLADSAMAFWRAGRRSVPWVLVATTDGIDCESSTFRKDPAGCGTFLRRYFNHEPSNFACIIGVGSEEAIDRKGLATLAHHANCPAVTLDGFGLLEELFLRIAVQVTTNLAGVQYSAGNLSWTELHRVRSLCQVPIDYCLLLDRSGSMFKPA